LDSETLVTKGVALGWEFADTFRYFVLSTGKPAEVHAFKPPTRAAAFSIPFVLRLVTAPALVCSAGQVQ